MAYNGNSMLSMELNGVTFLSMETQWLTMEHNGIAFLNMGLQCLVWDYNAYNETQLPYNTTKKKLFLI